MKYIKKLMHKKEQIKESDCQKSKNKNKRRSGDMSQEMTRQELIDLVETIRTMYDKNTQKELSEKEHVALVVKFEQSIKHPGGSDLIFYPELVGLSPKPTVDEIVDLAMKGI